MTDKCPKCGLDMQRGDCGLVKPFGCVTRQLAQSQAREKELKTALAVIELSFEAMQERAGEAEDVLDRLTGEVIAATGRPCVQRALGPTNLNIICQLAGEGKAVILSLHPQGSGGCEEGKRT